MSASLLGVIPAAACRQDRRRVRSTAGRPISGVGFAARRAWGSAGGLRLLVLLPCPPGHRMHPPGTWVSVKKPSSRDHPADSFDSQGQVQLGKLRVRVRGRARARPQIGEALLLVLAGGPVLVWSRDALHHLVDHRIAARFVVADFHDPHFVQEHPEVRVGPRRSSAQEVEELAQVATR